MIATRYAQVKLGMIGCLLGWISSLGGIVLAQDGTLTKLQVPSLPNAIRVTPKIISGGLPEGDEAFGQLQALGVKTIVSVDGATPDVAMAERHGMRYIHLPHGYDGVPEVRGRELAKAMLSMDGPIYVHCHHGRHRSPAAVAVACRTNGWMEAGTAKELLKLAGTNPNYRGLFRSVEEAIPVEPGVLAAMDVAFVAQAEIPQTAAAMVRIEHWFDALGQLQKKEWKADSTDEQHDPKHLALMLREEYTELLRMQDSKPEGDGYRKLMQEGETLARSLQEQLLQGNEVEPRNRAMGLLQANCKACHTMYRDNASAPR